MDNFGVHYVVLCLSLNSSTAPKTRPPIKNTTMMTVTINCRTVRFHLNPHIMFYITTNSYYYNLEVLLKKKNFAIKNEI